MTFIHNPVLSKKIITYTCEESRSRVTWVPTTKETAIKFRQVYLLQETASAPYVAKPLLSSPPLTDFASPRELTPA